jgi:hypothetical protein
MTLTESNHVMHPQAQTVPFSAFHAPALWGVKPLVDWADELLDSDVLHLYHYKFSRVDGILLL